MKDNKVAIIGVGNMLKGDEGAGIHVIKNLKDCTFSDDVELVDGGSGGFDLLPYLLDYTSVVMVYATADGQPAGTISHTSPEMVDKVIDNLSDFVETKGLMDPSITQNGLPEIHLITISIEEKHLERPSLELSPVIARSLFNIEKTVMPLVNQIYNKAQVA